jgi:hypothetical protein
MDNTQTYWNHNGKFEDLANKLQKLIPDSGAVPSPRKNVALEKYRKAVNCYYDLYNNGLCNRARLFASVFGVASGRYGSYRLGFSPSLYAQVEEKMNSIVLAAGKEQGLI